MKVELIDNLGNDLTVVNAARVSLDKYKNTFDEKDRRLIGFLARNEHKSPFYHVNVQLRMSVPIFIARQYWRHHIGIVRNEVSRRYVDDWLEFWFPDEFRERPDQSIKQGSGGPLPAVKQKLVKGIYNIAIKVSEQAYKSLIRLNVAPEQARAVLPQAMYTTWVETGNLFAHANMCRERLSPHAQVEIQQLAKLVEEQAKKVAPYSWAALEEHIINK